MPQEWYVRVGSEETGPLTLQELFVRCRTGQLEPKSPVRSSDGNGKWRHAENVDEILFGNPEELREARRNVLRSPNPDLDECYWNEVFERVEESRSYFEGYSSSTNGGSSAKSDDSNNAAVHYGRGWAWLLKDDFDAAIREFTDAVRLDPRSAASFHARGTAWLSNGDFASAMRDFDAAIRLDPKYALPSAYNIKDILDALWELHEDSPDSAPSLISLWPDCPPKLLKVLQEILNPAFEAEQIIASPENEADEGINGPKPLQPHEGYRPVPSSSYVLTKELGSGHFGAVWRAEHPTFGPSVFKFCTKPDQRWIKSLQNEMQKTYQLSHPKSHPGIVTLLGEHLSDSRIPCLQYEFVDGRDLRKVLGGESEKEKQFAPFKPDHAAAVILKLVEIMAYVHDRPQPVVHRDLKPANILVTNHRDLDVLTAIGVERDLRLAKFKVMDFGLAGHARPQGQPDSEYSIGAQFDGTGTTAYMSPQQKRREPSHPSDDIFAIGVMWYELLAGKVGFGPPGLRAIERLQKDFQLRGGTSEQWKVLVDCLDEDREHRIKSAMELKERIHATYTLEKPVDLFEQVKQAVKRGASFEKVTSLSVEMAVVVVGNVEELQLNGLTMITPEVAHALAQSHGVSLSLNGLTTITPEVAHALAQSHGVSLSLDGLTTITPEVAHALAQSHVSNLSLNGLTTITPEVAHALAQSHMSNLSLNGLTTITPEVAHTLTQSHRPDLSINRLTTITPEVVQILAQRSWSDFSLNGLTTITPEVAHALAQSHWERLSLNGLTTITPEIAQALAQSHGSDLSLSGLTTIAPEAAQALAKWGGDYLSLNGLESLTPEVAQALAKWEGIVLSLDGLETLTPDVAEALSEWEGKHISLDAIQEVSLTTLRAFGRFAKDQDWESMLDQLETLTPDDAQTLVELLGYEDISLDSLADLTPEVAHIFAKTFKGSTIHLNGLTTLSPKAAQALSKWWRTDWGIWSGELKLDGIKNLTAEAAQALAKWEGNYLSLDGLEMLTPEVAQALAKWEGIVLSLDGLETLTPDVAQILANWEGKRISAADLPTGPATDAGTDWRWFELMKKSLSLCGIKSLEPKAAKALSNWDPPFKDCWGVGRLVLSGIEKLSPDESLMLAEFRQILVLDGISDLSRETALSLAKHPGFLVLDGVASLSQDSAKSLATRSSGWGMSLHGLEVLTPEVASELCKIQGGRLVLGNLTGPTTFLELQSLKPASKEIWDRVKERRE